MDNEKLAKENKQQQQQQQKQQEHEEDDAGCAAENVSSYALKCIFSHFLAFNLNLL